MARPLALAALALFIAAPSFAQRKKDYTRATEYVEGDADFKNMKNEEFFKNLSQADQDTLVAKIIQEVAEAIHGKSKKEIYEVDIVYKVDISKGKLNAYEKKFEKEVDKDYTEIENKQDKDPKTIILPAKSEAFDLPNLGALFPDNEWTPSGTHTTTIDEILAKTAESLKSMGATVSGVIVRASASTLRNTEQAVDLTYKQLSAKRANAAKEMILNALNTQGLKDTKGQAISVPEVNISVDGQNGDGTSGPGSPYACPKDTPAERCSPGNDEPFDKHCGLSTGTGGAPPVCEAPKETIGCAWLPKDEHGWDGDCEAWKLVKSLRSKARYKYSNGGKDKTDNWTTEEILAVKKFYAPFKYVEGRICAVYPVTSTESEPGSAHIILLYTKVESNGTIRIRGRVRTTKPQHTKPSGGKKKKPKFKTTSCTL